jgi:DNA-binding transcriptional LysR family regulator
MRQFYCSDHNHKYFFDMRGLNLDQLRALTEVAALGSFSAAARSLHLSQPAISLQIRELEKRFGLPLLHRVSKRAVATAAGRELIAHARRLFETANQARTAMQRYKDGRIGRVHLGTGATALIHLLPPILRRLRMRYTDIDIAVTTGTTPDITDHMLNDKIDIGLVTLPVDERAFLIHPLRKDMLVAIFPAGTRNVPGKITPADVAKATLILEDARANHSRLIREWLRKEGFDARPIMELDNIEAIKTVVTAGLGISIVPGQAVSTVQAKRGLILRPLHPPLRHALALIHRRDRPLDEAATIVMKELRSLSRQ